jgi:response regulator RpfG family c-di-GMP phosphodiesterase
VTKKSAPPLHQHATILVVEDEETTLRLLKRMLQRAGYQDIHTTMDPFEALTLYREFCPDLVVLDLHMPSYDGFVVLEQLRAEAPERGHLPVLMLTGDTSTEAKHQAFALGVTDFLTKPLDFLEVRGRVSNLLQTRLLHLEMQYRNRFLGEILEVHAPDPEESRPAALPYVPAARKPRVAAVRQNLVGQVAGCLSGKLGLAEQVVLARHEHRDGSGYPQGLSGEQIPLASRIVAVAEHFADLAGSPFYCSTALTRVDLMEIVVRGGRRFDPQVVRALVDLHAQGTLGAAWKISSETSTPAE